jgi:hypothetical protein
VVLRVDLRLLEPSRFNTDEEYWRDFEYPDGTVVRYCQELCFESRQAASCNSPSLNVRPVMR